MGMWVVKIEKGFLTSLLNHGVPETSRNLEDALQMTEMKALAVALDLRTDRFAARAIPYPTHLEQEWAASIVEGI